MGQSQGRSEDRILVGVECERGRLWCRYEGVGCKGGRTGGVVGTRVRPEVRPGFAVGVEG